MKMAEGAKTGLLDLEKELTCSVSIRLYWPALSFVLLHYTDLGQTTVSTCSAWVDNRTS